MSYSLMEPAPTKGVTKTAWFQYTKKKPLAPATLIDCMDTEQRTPKNSVTKFHIFLIMTVVLMFLLYWKTEIPTVNRIKGTDVTDSTVDEVMAIPPKATIIDRSPFVSYTRKEKVKKIVKSPTEAQTQRTNISWKQQFNDPISPIFEVSYKEGKRYPTHQKAISLNNGTVLTVLLSPRADEMCHVNVTGRGPIRINQTKLSIEDVEELLPEVKVGGCYTPAECIPRHKVAVLVPYRNRSNNLATFLLNIHPFLIKQNLEYRIFVIEQSGNELFNRGRLYNAGFIEMQKHGSFKCVVFHDVDLLPLDERILYTCPSWPRHMCAIVKERTDDPSFKTLFGGVTALTVAQFMKTNGYSNLYWGWGGEDVDMFWRLRSVGLPIVRYDKRIAKYSALPHELQEKNRRRFRLLKSAILRPKFEGLNTTDYKLFNTTLHHLYTRILIDINPYREDIVSVHKFWMEFVKVSKQKNYTNRDEEFRNKFFLHEH